MNKYLALDLGGTFLKAAIIDGEVNIIDKWKVSSKAESIEDILKVFDSAVLGHLDGVSAITISCPGRIDSKKGIMLTAGYFENFLNGFEIVNVLNERYHLPIYVDNDAKCAANAELWKGSLQNVNNAIVYIIGTGIGGGIIIDHKVYKGSNFAAGEFSQIISNISKKISKDNEICKQLSTPFLLENYKKEINSDKDITGEEFFELVESKDKIANKVLRKYCKLTVRALFNLQTCFDVDTIAIGGGISAQPILLKVLNKELNKIYKENSTASVKPNLVRCKFLNDANLIGAVKLALDK